MAELRLEQTVAWVAEGESATQEFKLSTGQRSEAAKTLSAMLNQRGGRVLFGIEPGTGQPKGQQVGDKTLAAACSTVQRDILAFLNGEGACRLSQIEAFLGGASRHPARARRAPIAQEAGCRRDVRPGQGRQVVLGRQQVRRDG